jgi:hypothetical protein
VIVAYAHLGGLATSAPKARTTHQPIDDAACQI